MKPILAMLLLAIAHTGWAAEPSVVQPVPEKMFVLTFDDACASHATYVAPLLKKHGFGATFFVCEFPPAFESNKKAWMTWEQIAELNRQGFEIGSHTRTHQLVQKLTSGQFAKELEVIEQRCAEHGIPKPISFAYPAGYSTSAAIAVLAEHGYQFARSVENRPYRLASDSPFLIPCYGFNRNKDGLKNLLNCARDGQVVVLILHGVPDIAHPQAGTTPEDFEVLLKFLHDNQCTVVAMRDLKRYMKPESNIPAPLLSTEFGEGMVLPCDAPASVWGRARPGETVTVTFAEQKKTARADANGVWRITFDPLTASTTPRTLTVSSGYRIEEVPRVIVGAGVSVSRPSSQE